MMFKDTAQRMITAGLRLATCRLVVCALVFWAIQPAALGAKFGFDIRFLSGSLMGQSFTGAVATTAGDGQKYFQDGSMLAFSLAVGGVAFQPTDDVDFPSFPLADISGGQLVAFDFASLFSNPSLGVVYSESYNIVEYGDAATGFSLGSVVRTYSIPDVSEAFSWLGGLLAFAGLGGLYRLRCRCGSVWG